MGSCSCSVGDIMDIKIITIDQSGTIDGEPAQRVDYTVDGNLMVVTTPASVDEKSLPAFIEAELIAGGYIPPVVRESEPEEVPEPEEEPVE